VLHAHGRKSPVSLQAEQYIRGRGAFYCKHIADKDVLKLAYWEVRHLVGQGLSRNFRPSVTMLRSLAAGAALRLFQREN
jgi:hypothetical protein